MIPGNAIAGGFALAAAFFLAIVVGNHAWQRGTLWIELVLLACISVALYLMLRHARRQL